MDYIAFDSLFCFYQQYLELEMDILSLQFQDHQRPDISIVLY